MYEILEVYWMNVVGIGSPRKGTKFKAEDSKQNMIEKNVMRSNEKN